MHSLSKIALSSSSIGLFHQLLKHCAALTVSAERRLRMSVTIRPPEENARSTGTLVAGMDRISLAIRATDGYCSDPIVFHQLRTSASSTTGSAKYLSKSLPAERAMT